MSLNISVKTKGMVGGAVGKKGSAEPVPSRCWSKHSSCNGIKKNSFIQILSVTHPVKSKVIVM